MGGRFTRFALAAVLAVASFAFARYRYLDRHSATIGDVTLTNPLRDKHLLGDWMKDELVFAIILPVALLAGGAVWAVRK